MSDLLSLGASGVRAYQTAIDVVGENISNANVQGYSRRTAVLAEVGGGSSGYPLSRQTGSGLGVNVTGVLRAYNSFLTNDARTASGNYSRLDSRQQWLTQIQSYLNTGSSSVSGQLSSFYNAAQDLATDPTSVSARDAFRAAAGNVASQFKSLAQSFDATQAGIKQDVDQTVNRINELTSSLAELNNNLRRSSAGSAQAASLADQRDSMLDELASLTKINAQINDDGTVNVRLENSNGPLLLNQSGAKLLGSSIANGQVQLTLDPFGQSGLIAVPDSGSLAGLADAYAQATSSANAIDDLANHFAATVNAVNRQGVDLNGNPGGDIFATSTLVATPSRTNTGQGTVNMSVTDQTNLFAGGYELRYDGTTSQWTLSRTDGSATISGTGSLDLDGVHVDVGGAPGANDWYAIQPETGAAGMRLLMTDSAGIATAAAWSADVSASNQGSGTVALRTNSASQTLAAPVPSRLVVTMGAGNSYEISDAADTNVPPAVLASGAYVSGGWIAVNGFDVQLSGTIQQGDSFTIAPTPAGAANNANALALIATRNGNPGFEANYSRQVTQVASNLANTTSLATASKSALDTAKAARDSVSAVNLDEEAADLIRFQQAYQASAKVIAAARDIFQTMLDLK